MAKRRPIPTRPTYMHLNPALLQRIDVLKIIVSEPTSAWWPNRLETDPPYKDYAEVEIIYVVIELLEVPVSDATLAKYRAKASRSILQYLKDRKLR
jgi:hypothetical protein